MGEKKLVKSIVIDKTYAAMPEYKQTFMDYVARTIKSDLGGRLLDEILQSGDCIVSVRPVMRCDTEIEHLIGYRQEIIVKPLVRCRDCIHRTVYNDLGDWYCDRDEFWETTEYGFCIFGVALKEGL